MRLTPVAMILAAITAQPSLAGAHELLCTTNNAGGPLEVTLSEEVASVRSVERQLTLEFRRNHRYRPRFGDKVQFTARGPEGETLKLVLDRAALAGRSALPYGRRILGRWDARSASGLSTFANYSCRFR